MPALLSSAARIPPAPPTPTMTTSVFSLAILRPPRRRFGLRLQAHHRRTREGLFALEFGFAELRLGAGKTDEPPAREVLVAAIDGVGKHALHRMGAQRIEESARVWPGKAFGLARFQRGDDGILLHGREARKRRAVGLAAISIELRQAMPIELLLIG